MPVFNPEQNVNPGQPYFWSRPTQEPKPDISGELRGKALQEGLSAGASAIREGAQGITAAYEKGIQNTIYQAVDPLRDQYMEHLHEVDKTLRGNENVPDPTGRDAPRDVKQLPGTLDTLDSARANGKISQTDYDARLNSLAKEVRAKYPGFRSYVDEEFKRITGRDSANQYIRSVIQDIDSFVAAKSAKRDKLESELWANLKYPGMQDQLKLYKSDPDKYAGQVLDFLARSKQKEYLDEKYSRDITTMEKERTLTEKAAQDKGDAYSTESAGHAWSLTRDWLSIQKGQNKGDQSIQDLAIQASHGEVPSFKNEEQKAQFGALINQVGELRKSQRAAELRGVLGTSVSEDWIQKKVEAEYKANWEPYTKALTSGEWSVAGATKKMLDGKIADAKGQLIDNQQFGRTLQFLDAAGTIDPALRQALLQTPQFMSLPADMAAYMVNQNAQMANPNDPNKRSLPDLIKESKVKNVPDGQVQKSAIDLVGEIAKKGPDAISKESKIELAKRAFGPNSQGLLNLFAKDSWNAEPGKPLSLRRNFGQQSIFNVFTSDGMVAEMYKLGKENPSLWDNYVKWTGNEVQTLLTDHALAVTPEQNRMSMSAGFPKEDIHADYDDKGSTFTFRMGNRSLMNSRSDLANLSRNLKSISDIARQDGADPNVAVLGTLLAMHPEPGSILDKMIMAIEATRSEQ